MAARSGWLGFGRLCMERDRSARTLCIDHSHFLFLKQVYGLMMVSRYPSRAQAPKLTKNLALATFATLALALGGLVACGGGSATSSTSSAFMAGDEESHFQQALEARSRGQLEDAIAHLDIAIQANPRYLALHMTKGDIMMDMRRYAEARDSYATAVQLRDRSIDAHLGLAKAYYALGDYPSANIHARRALDELGTHARPAQRSEVLLTYGEILIAVQDYQQAGDILSEALAIDGGNTLARIELARLRYRTGQIPEAIRMLAHAENYEEDPALLYELGALFHEFTLYERAVSALQKARDNGATDDDTTYYLADANMRSGNRDIGIQLASEVIGRNPAYYRAYTVRGRGELRRGQSDMGRTAIETMPIPEEGEEVVPLAPGARSDTGFLDRARADANHVLGLEPDNYDALILLGDVEREAGNNAQAETHYRRALELAPSNVDGIDAMATLYFRESRYREFVDLISPHIDRPDRLETWRSPFIDALIAMGDTARGIQYKSELALERSSDAQLNRDTARLALDNPGSLEADIILRHARIAVERSGGGTIDYRLLIVDALVNAGLVDEANAQLALALQAWPTNPEVIQRRDELQRRR